MEGAHDAEDVCEVLPTEVAAATRFDALHPAVAIAHQQLAAMSGLEHAVRVVLGEATHSQMCKLVYEAGLLLCVATLVRGAHAHDPSLARAWLAHFPQRTALALMSFLKALEATLPRGTHVHLDHLPADTADVWTAHRARVVAAVSRVQDTRDHVDFACYLHSRRAPNARVAITQIKEATIVLPLKCGVCFERAEPQDACEALGGSCRYVTCAGCRRTLGRRACPFCRSAWRVAGHVK